LSLSLLGPVFGAYPMATLEQRGDHRFVVKARLVGLLLANWAVRGMMAIQSPTPIPIAADLSIDTRVLLFALGLLVLTGIAFGLAPAIRASRPDLVVTMRDESSLAVWRSRRFSLRNGLVVLQVAMSFVLLMGAGLFIRSLGNASSIETGFSDQLPRNYDAGHRWVRANIRHP